MSFEGKDRRDVALLYVVHLASYVLPLLTVTYVARVLGPAQWGLLAFFHSFGLYTSQVIEYGFSLSATRDVARYRDSADARAAALSEVNAAKIVLSAAFLALLIPVFFLLPMFSANPLLFAVSVAYSLAQGFGMMWYFQGLGRIRELAGIDVVSRAAASILTCVVVRHPGDAWKMIALNAAACVVTAAIGLARSYRDTPVRGLSFGGGIRLLRTGFALFLFRGASTLFTSANGFLLGLFAPPVTVGYYAGAERAHRGLVALLYPITQVLYARLNYSMGQDSVDKKQLGRSAFQAMFGAGLLLGAAAWIFAPWIVRILLGPGFEPSVPALRVLAAALVADAIATSLGMQWMLPLGLDRQFTTVILAAGLTNLALAPLLTTRYGHIGMCFSVLMSQIVVALGCFLYLRSRQLDPFSPGPLPTRELKGTA